MLERADVPISTVQLAKILDVEGRSTVAESGPYKFGDNDMDVWMFAHRLDVVVACPVPSPLRFSFSPCVNAARELGRSAKTLARQDFQLPPNTIVLCHLRPQRMMPLWCMDEIQWLASTGRTRQRTVLSTYQKRALRERHSHIARLT